MQDIGTPGPTLPTSDIETYVTEDMQSIENQKCINRAVSGRG